MSQLKQGNSDFVGLQYIIEIHADKCSNATTDGDETSELADKNDSAPNNTPRYECVICNRKLDTLTILVSHIKSLFHKLKYAVSI